MEDIRKHMGQMFITGISSTSLNEDEKRLLKDFNIGGVILFKRNYENLNQLISLIREIYEVMDNPFIGVDQEGGNVIRFSSPFTQFPPMANLGKAYEKSHSMELSRLYASRLSLELKSCGLNLCFIPVLDVLTNTENKVIGSRAFSTKKEIVSELGASIIEGFRKNLVLSCAKHFPGHGDTFEDSHDKLPVLRCSSEIIKKREMAPFRRAVRAGVPLIMTAHVQYSELDNDSPATLSKKILTGMLREEMKYENLIITDDLDMKAIRDNYGLEEASSKSIHAGADIILICHSIMELEKVHGHLLKESQKDKLLRKNIIESIDRIKITKEKYRIIKRDILFDDAKIAFSEDSGDLVDKMNRYS